MKDINIAATTALQSIDPIGREKAINIGANILMPNITPRQHRKDYFLYENKPCKEESPDECISCLISRVSLSGNEIYTGAWGDSPNFFRRK